MANDTGKSSNIHIPVTLLLMVSVVMFIGSLYYLVVEGPWIFSPKTDQQPVSLPITQQTSVLIEEPQSLGEALEILFKKEYTIVSFDIDTTKYNIKQISFYVLTEKATKTQVVIVTTINEKAVLSVLENGCLWIWSP